jgi:hypothetical protein
MGVLLCRGKGLNLARKIEKVKVCAVFLQFDREARAILAKRLGWLLH